MIQFFGGIHEIYFPYVLAKPILLLGAIAGGMVGIGTLAVFDAGLRAPAAPGSIIAVLAQTPGGNFVGSILSVLLAGDDVLRHLLAAAQARAATRASRPGRGDRRDGGAEGHARAPSPACCRPRGGGRGRSWRPPAGGGAARGRGTATPIHRIVFACDAGMGSSAMGASVLRNKIKKAGFADVTVRTWRSRT